MKHTKETIERAEALVNEIRYDVLDQKDKLLIAMWSVNKTIKVLEDILEEIPPYDYKGIEQKLNQQKAILNYLKEKI